MRGQEHTVMGYLTWAVFFAAVLLIVHYIFDVSIKTSVPSQLPQVLDVVRSAVAAGSSGINAEVCTYLIITGKLGITEGLIRRNVNLPQSINEVRFTCEKENMCEEKDDGLLLKGGKGNLCAKVQGAALYIEWK